MGYLNRMLLVLLLSSSAVNAAPEKPEVTATQAENSTPATIVKTHESNDHREFIATSLLVIAALGFVRRGSRGNQPPKATKRSIQRPQKAKTNKRHLDTKPPSAEIHLV